MIRECTAIVYGRVQGVNFRRRLSNLAKELGILGFVQNIKDGSVYFLVQGEEEVIDQLLIKVQHSFFPAKVTGMKIEWREVLTENLVDFHINKDENFIVDEAKSFINLGKELLSTEEINVPKHVIVIPDGNRRWAREKGWKAYVGHRRGANVDRMAELLMQCKSYGVTYFTFWAFSTENWKREQSEINELFKIFIGAGKKLKALFIKEKIKFKHLGRKDRLPADVINLLSELEAATKDFTNLNFQMCMDYGGRNSIVEAVNKLISAGEKEVTEDLLCRYLDSSELPEPDLIIRTSGEKRLSGIMPYESVYAELYFTNVHFPDFDAEEFRRALLDYSARKRRFGGTNSKDLQNISDDQLVDPDKLSKKANLNIKLR